MDEKPKCKTIKLQTIKFLEENIGRTPFDINRSNFFLDPFPKAKEIKAKINRWKLLKSFSAQQKNPSTK